MNGLGKVMEVQIVGLGTSLEDEKCIFSGLNATGYVDIGDGLCTPCKLSKLGSGKLGDDVIIPSEWESKLNELRRIRGLSYISECEICGLVNCDCGMTQ